MHLGIEPRLAGCLEVVDVDRDDRPDLFQSGYDETLEWGVDLYRNVRVSANQPPSAPPNVRLVALDNDTLQVAWDAAGDAETPAAGLRYGVSVINLDSGLRLTPAMWGADGRRLIPGLEGLGAPRLDWTLQRETGSAFPIGTYRVEVRAFEAAVPWRDTVLEPGDFDNDGGQFVSVEMWSDTLGYYTRVPHIGAGALPVNTPATTVEASSQPDEPLPESTQKTVWWAWTPAASGWVKFSTTGTDGDTVLAIYTGSALNALTLIMANDDGLPGLHVSDVIIPVEAGRTYRIQAGGFEGWAGAFDLSITAYDAPPEVTALTLDNPVADVTNGLADVTGTITFRHPLGIRDSALFLMKPGDSSGYSSQIFSSVTVVSSTATETTHRFSFRMERYLEPGLFPFLITMSNADTGGLTLYGRITPYPAGIAKGIM